MKVSACDFSGAYETLSLNWTLRSMMSRSGERSISLYPFTPSGYPKKCTQFSIDQVPSPFHREFGAMHVNEKCESGSLPV
jgi:hypothetical protein